MNSNDLREKVYTHSVEISAFITLVFVTISQVIGPLIITTSDKSSLISISVTLSGFLFAGQGIMLTLPENNKFIVLAKSHGYFYDFHRLCRWAEIVFIASVPLGLDAISRLFLDTGLISFIYFFLVFWALIMSIWALILFSRIISNLN